MMSIMPSIWIMSRVEHTLRPIYDKDSRILILGSMPSVKSRELGSYYGHSSNRFWRVLEVLYGESIIDREKFVLAHNIALFDVIASCDIESSSDSSIKNVVPNDIEYIINNSKIDRIFLTGKTAYNLYNKYIYPKTGIEGIYLPSPSAANAACSFEKLVSEYKKIII